VSGRWKGARGREGCVVKRGGGLVRRPFNFGGVIPPAATPRVNRRGRESWGYACGPPAFVHYNGVGPGETSGRGCIMADGDKT
jgi:hypothetical protein